MNHLPIFLDLRGRKVVVIGEGAAAERRAELARAAGAEICRTADFRGAVAAFVATGDAGTDAAAAKAAREAGVPVNAMDRPALCDFIMPAIVQRGDVIVAVSTGGASPTLAQSVRRRIEAALPERLGDLARLAAQFRPQVIALLSFAARRAFWRRLVDGPAGHLALSGDLDGARRTVLRDLDAARAGTAPAGIVHTVDADSGDPDLLTLRAARWLQEADAVLYDERVSPSILARARREAEMVRVGRLENVEAEIDRRLRAGQIVVRLKAGEAAILAEAV